VLKRASSSYYHGLISSCAVLRPYVYRLIIFYEADWSDLALTQRPAGRHLATTTLPAPRRNPTAFGDDATCVVILRGLGLIARAHYCRASKSRERTMPFRPRSYDSSQPPKSSDRCFYVDSFTRRQIRPKFVTLVVRSARFSPNATVSPGIYLAAEAGILLVI
jgi:hypothetical protein